MWLALKWILKETKRLLFIKTCRDQPWAHQSFNAIIMQDNNDNTSAMCVCLSLFLSYTPTVVQKWLQLVGRLLSQFAMLDRCLMLSFSVKKGKKGCHVSVQPFLAILHAPTLITETNAETGDFVVKMMAMLFQPPITVASSCSIKCVVVVRLIISIQAKCLTLCPSIFKPSRGSTEESIKKWEAKQSA